MDRRRFDDLTRLLGAAGTRRSGLRAALGGLLGMGAGATPPALDAQAKRRGHDADRSADADRKRHKKRCTPACTDGYACVKAGRKRECQCRSGVTCGAACCAAGQSCQDGQCAAPPPACILAGQPCKDVGRPCCDGRTCASGQGGETDIACYAPKTGTCASTAECVYGTRCEDGRCVGIPQPNGQVIEGLGTACDAAQGDTCAAPNATCVAYDGAGAPGGDHCTLPLNYACTGDPECTCYHCGWVEAGQVDDAGRRAARTVTPPPRLACCGPAGYACRSDRNCCLGETCVGGVCGPCQLEATHQYNVAMPTSAQADYYEPALGIGFLPDGRMLVSNGTTGQAPRGIDVFTDDPDDGWLPSGFFSNDPSGTGSNFGLAVSADGTVYDAQKQNHVVSIWEQSGSDWVQIGQIGDGTTGQLNEPLSVALLPDGRVVVSEIGGFRVSVWQGSGNAWTRVAQFAYAPGTYPWAVAAAANGDVYVSRTDYGTECSVTVWRESGGQWSQVDTVGSPVCDVDWGWYGYGILLFGPYVLVSDEEVSVWSKEAGVWVRRTQFGFPDEVTPDAPDALNYPYQLAVGPDGLVYIADAENERVSVWSLACTEN